MPQEKFPFLPYHTPRTRGLHLLGTALATSLSICLLPAEKGEVQGSPWTPGTSSEGSLQADLPEEIISSHMSQLL